MNDSAPSLSASEAARRLGVSTKALRLYEKRGLVIPGRTAAGYRAYGPDTMTRAVEIVALRALGLSLARLARVLEGDAKSLDSALAAHEATLHGEIRELVGSIAKTQGIRSALVRGEMPSLGELARLQTPYTEFSAAFELPWPWGGEWFELRDIRPLNYTSARWQAARPG